MKKSSIVAIGILTLGLSACATQEIDRGITPSSRASQSGHASQSSVVSSPASPDWITVNDENFELSFSQPSAWGHWSLEESPSQSQTDVLSEMSFSILSRAMRGSGIGMANATVIFRKYDNGKFRYEEVCNNYAETCFMSDLLREKEEFTKTDRIKIGNTLATVQDSYSVPSAYVMREVRFYTPTHRAHLIASYDIGDFLAADGSSDLFAAAQRILGEEFADPINRLSKMYPEELGEMTAFYKEVDLFLQSIKVMD